MKSFLSLAEAAQELAGKDATPDHIETWLSLLEQQAEQLNAVKSWIEHRDAFPGGIGYIRRPDEWRISRVMFNAWRRSNGLLMQADEQTTNAATAVAESASNDTTPDPERRLACLRALGGNATYKSGKWRINGISALVAKEKSEGNKRSDEKTIRADLKEAAENERDAKRANAFSGLGQR